MNKRLVNRRFAIVTTKNKCVYRFDLNTGTFTRTRPEGYRGDERSFDLEPVGFLPFEISLGQGMRIPVERENGEYKTLYTSDVVSVVWSHTCA